MIGQFFKTGMVALPKKMRRTATAIFLLTISLACQARHKPDTIQSVSCIGIIPGHRIVTLGISHKVTEHWSVSGEVMIGIPRHAGDDNGFDNHNEEFIMKDDDEVPAIGNSGSLTVRFWPENVYKGFFIYIGGRCSMHGDAYGSLGAGYMMEIYKDIAVMLSYGRETGSSTDFIRVGLCIKL